MFEQRQQVTPLKNLKAFLNRPTPFRIEVAPNGPREQRDILAHDSLEAKSLVRNTTKLSFVTNNASSQVF
jgi:hypothetical protein